MKFFLSALSVLVFTSLSVFAQQPSGITVTGKATIEKAPDQFTVTFTFESRHALVYKAKARVDSQVKQLLNILKKLNIEEQGITSTNIQISPIYPRVDRKQRNVYIEEHTNKGEALVSVNQSPEKAHKQPIVFDVRRRVEVNLADIRLYETLLDKAVKAGVARISPVHSRIANSDKYYQQALSKAVENARAKAKRIAENLDVTLGNVTSLHEHAYRAPGKMMMAREAMVSDSSMRSYTGLNQISAEVTVTFSLQN